MPERIDHYNHKNSGVLQEKTVLFLYTRLPDYFYQCIQHFVRSYPYRVVVIRYQEDVNARYAFAADERIRLLYKDDVDVAAFIKKLIRLQSCYLAGLIKLMFQLQGNT